MLDVGGFRLPLLVEVVSDSWGMLQIISDETLQRFLGWHLLRRGVPFGWDIAVRPEDLEHRWDHLSRLRSSGTRSHGTRHSLRKFLHGHMMLSERVANGLSSVSDFSLQNF